VGWMLDLELCLHICLACVLRCYSEKFDRLNLTSFYLYYWIGGFTLIGLEKGINIGLHVVCVALSTSVTTYGGVVVIFCTEIL
jgi:hypothetical protein